MSLSKKLQQTILWVFSGDLKQNKPGSLQQPSTVHIHYEFHQHLHIKVQDDLYHKVLNNVIQELPISLASPQAGVFKQTLPVKSYSVI